MSNNVLTKNSEQVAGTFEGASLPCYTPAVEVLQNDDSIMLLAEMPGVSEDSVDITLEKGFLTIEGSAYRDSYEGYSVVRSEAPLGNYKRSFRITEDIDLERVDASIKNGVLKLVMPIHEKAKPRTIQVRAE